MLEKDGRQLLTLLPGRITLDNQTGRLTSSLKIAFLHNILAFASTISRSY